MTQALEGTFNPAFHFLGLIQKSISDGITRHCVHVGSTEVYLVPEQQAYYASYPDITSLEALCLAAPFDLNVKLMPNWRPDKDQDVQAARTVIHRKAPTANSMLVGYPLQELLWYAALCGSGGQLLQGCNADTPVRLVTCPDFSRLFHREFDPALAASMLEKSVALTFLSETTGVPLAQIFEFYNACAALGLITIEPEDVFDPANYLLGLIEKADADRQIRCCELAGHPPLYLVPDENKYYTEEDPVKLAKLCAAQLSEFKVGIVDNDAGEEEVVQIGRTRIRRKKEPSLPKLPGHPISELVFHVALYASQGRLLSGYKLNEPVRLKSWPDKALLKEAASIKDERYFFPLAAFMSTKVASLSEIAEATHLPLERVIDFHNACAVADLLDHPS